jgi:hypothetical protein
LALEVVENFVAAKPEWLLATTVNVATNPLGRVRVLVNEPSVPAVTVCREDHGVAPVLAVPLPVVTNWTASPAFQFFPVSVAVAPGAYVAWSALIEGLVAAKGAAVCVTATNAPATTTATKKTRSVRSPRRCPRVDVRSEDPSSRMS